jgi:hypothetical protein
MKVALSFVKFDITNLIITFIPFSHKFMMHTKIPHNILKFNGQVVE